MSAENTALTVNQVAFLRAYLEAGADRENFPLSRLMDRLAHYIAFKPSGMKDQANEKRRGELVQLQALFATWQAEDPSLDQLAVFRRLLEQLQIVEVAADLWRGKNTHKQTPALKRLWHQFDENADLQELLERALPTLRSTTADALRAETAHWRRRAEEAERRLAAALATPPPPISESDKIFAALPDSVRQIKKAAYERANTREQLAEINRKILADHRKKLEADGVPAEDIEESVERYGANLEAEDDRWAAEESMG